MFKKAIPATPKTAAAFIACAYAFFAGLWILLARGVAPLLARDAASFWSLNDAFCVSATAVLLYILVRAVLSRMSRCEDSALRLAGIIESSDDAVVGASTEGLIESWNPAAERLFGYAAAEIIGRHVSSLCPPPLLEDQARMIRRVALGEAVHDLETVRLAKGGRPAEVSMSLARIKGPRGETAGYAAVYRDNAAKKRLEAQFLQAQKMEVVGRLAGGVAHDFNNLLTAIGGFSHFLLESLPKNDPRRADALEIAKAGERAAALTRQLLAFSRRQPLSEKILDVNAVVADMEKMLRRVIRENVELVFRPSPGLGRVKADPGQLEQIILNLSVNAKDAMPEGGRLTIETANADPTPADALTHPGLAAGPRVTLTVRDTGAGMSREVLSHLFEPFFTTKEPGKGTGLGLATVYGIVKQSGGNVYVDSEPGRGSSFTIYLPRVAEPREEAQAPVAGGKLARGGETILLVEDEELVRKFAARVLAESGYGVVSAARPEEALELCRRREEPISILLTDIVMPEMHGYELARRLSSLRPRMKVIFMTGYSDASVSQSSSHNGALFIYKPMTADALLGTVRRALDGPGGES